MKSINKTIILFLVLLFSSVFTARAYNDASPYSTFQDVAGSEHYGSGSDSFFGSLGSGMSVYEKSSEKSFSSGGSPSGGSFSGSSSSSSSRSGSGFTSGGSYRTFNYYSSNTHSSNFNSGDNTSGGMRDSKSLESYTIDGFSQYANGTTKAIADAGANGIPCPKCKSGILDSDGKCSSCGYTFDLNFGIGALADDIPVGNGFWYLILGVLLYGVLLFFFRKNIKAYKNK
ncbi:hypothetical protein LJB98_03960 [Bacteroidales bacterium OttesenSCG-928-M11]|nr:hypothetical protein [Bacteroidales bacterium OttesenSCG-928-M11]